MDTLSVRAITAVQTRGTYHNTEHPNLQKIFSTMLINKMVNKMKKSTAHNQAMKSQQHHVRNQITRISITL